MKNNIIYMAVATALAATPLTALQAKESIPHHLDKSPKAMLEKAKESKQLTAHLNKSKNKPTARNARVYARDAYLAISDSNLRSCVKSKVTQMGISYADELSQLFCSNMQIGSLAGIEPFTGLIFVDFGFNHISDISPLSNLSNLTHAFLWQNQISDISAVSTWPSLYELDITSNPLTDISPLNGHQSINRLFVGNSGYTITDLSPISSLNQLEWLGIFDNQLTNADITIGLNNLQLVDLQNNPITDISALSQLSNLNDLGLMFTQVADLSPVLTLDNQFNWIGNYGNHAVYCWQQDYAQNQPNISFFDASTSCDSSTDFADFDNDGTPNTIEVMQGTDPFGPIAPPPPPTDMTFIEAISHVGDPQLQFCLTNVHNQTPYTYANELASLDCTVNNISSLNGIENFANLSQLLLASNQISDIAPLTALTQLQTLNLTDNNISYIEPLTQLSGLTDLGLANNPISDVYQLNQLTSLQILDIADTAINSASNLSSLTALTDLDITNTGLVDVSELNTLTNLNRLMMDFNAISDASAVLQLTDNWQQLSLSSQTFCWQLDYVENFTTVNLWQRPPSCDYSDDFNDFDGDGILNIDEILFGSNPFTAGPPASLTYDEALMLVSDANLYNCLLSAKQSHYMASDLTALYCMYQGINNINGLEHFSGLTHVDLGDNNIADISPIASLTNLNTLYIFGNSIVDISPVASLTQLTNLWAFDNNISDISALANTTALQEVVLANNPLSNVSALTGLPALTYVDLYQTLISNLNGFENLPGLTYLDITGTGVSDISPLSNASVLDYLLLNNTSVVDVSAVIQHDNAWQLLWLAENTYCWQLEYINNYLSVNNLQAPAACDSSDDFNDLDNDGVSNFDEVIQGRDPFNADILPPPATIIEGINALTDGNLANCIYNTESSRLNDPIESLEIVACYGQNINQLDGLGHFSGLRHLDIMNNNVTSIEPLRGLNNLEMLFSDNNPIDSVAAISELPALFDIGLNQSTVADVSALFTSPNVWQAITFSEHNYCWQVSYADSALNLSYFWAAPSCDSSDDLNDFDNDGIDNASEVAQGTSPFVAN